MSLPYGGDKGNTVIRIFKRILETNLPYMLKPEISVKGRKIASHFNVKDKIDERHISGFVYEFNYNWESTCTDDYNAETVGGRFASTNTDIQTNPLLFFSTAKAKKTRKSQG